MYLITGATGHFGRAALESLLTRVPAGRIAVSVRSLHKAGPLKMRGVDVRRGDFDDPSSLVAAFSGVERLLIISTDGEIDDRIRQHRAAVAAAKTAGVGFIAYTSIAKADSTSLVFGKVHHSSEQAIRATGIPFCFLRNDWYLENEIEAIKGALGGAPIVTSAGEGRVGWATRRDYAEAAAAVLATDSHANAIYELAGPPIAYDDLASLIAEVLGRAVPVRHVDDVTFRATMSEAGLPASVVDLLANIQTSIAQGALDVESDDLATLLGRPPTALNKVIEKIAGEVRATP